MQIQQCENRIKKLWEETTNVASPIDSPCQGKNWKRPIQWAINKEFDPQISLRIWGKLWDPVPGWVGEKRSKTHSNVIDPLISKVFRCRHGVRHRIWFDDTGIHVFSLLLLTRHSVDPTDKKISVSQFTSQVGPFCRFYHWWGWQIVNENTTGFRIFC